MARGENIQSLQLFMTFLVRNRAMEPLYSSPAGTYDNVIFLNDVYFCMEDVLRLLLYDAGLKLY